MWPVHYKKLWNTSEQAGDASSKCTQVALTEPCLQLSVRPSVSLTQHFCLCYFQAITLHCVRSYYVILIPYSVCACVCVCSWRRCSQASASRCLLSGGLKTIMTATSWKTDSWGYKPSCKTWLHIRTLPTGTWHLYAVCFMIKYSYLARLCKLCALKRSHMIMCHFCFWILHIQMPRLLVHCFFYCWFYCFYYVQAGRFKSNKNTFMLSHSFSFTAWQWESFCVWMTRPGLLIVWRRAEYVCIYLCVCVCVLLCHMFVCAAIHVTSRPFKEESCH